MFIASRLLTSKTLHIVNPTLSVAKRGVGRHRQGINIEDVALLCVAVKRLRRIKFVWRVLPPRLRTVVLHRGVNIVLRLRRSFIYSILSPYYLLFFCSYVNIPFCLLWTLNSLSLCLTPFYLVENQIKNCEKNIWKRFV